MSLAHNIIEDLEDEWAEAGAWYMGNGGGSLVRLAIPRFLKTDDGYVNTQHVVALVADATPSPRLVLTDINGDDHDVALPPGKTLEQWRDEVADALSGPGRRAFRPEEETG